MPAMTMNDPRWLVWYLQHERKRRHGGSVDPSEHVFPAKDFYFTDFAGIADATTVRSLVGWSAYNSASSTSIMRDQWKVQSSRAFRVDANIDYAANVGLFIVGRDAGGVDHTLRAKITALPYSGGAIYLAVAATAENQCVVFECTNSGGVMQNFILRKIVAGTATTLMSQASATSGLGRSLQVNDEIEIQVVGQFVHLFVNGRRITPDAGAILDTGGAFTKGSIVGFGTRTAGQASFDDVYVAQLAGAATMTATSIFWPGSLSLAGRSVPLSGSYAGDVQAVDYRVINDSTGAVVKDWARISGATVSTGAWSGAVFVPMGSVPTNPKVRIQVRAANDTDIRALSGSTTVGIAIGSYGQSNSAYRGQGSATAHSAPNGYSWSQDAQSAWIGGTATNTQRSQLMAAQVAAASGIPCGAFIFGVASQNIVSLITEGAGGYFDELEAAATSANAYGYIQSWLWTQGEAEALAAGVFNESAYRANFDTLLTNLRAGLSGNQAVPVGVCAIGHTSGSHISGATFGDANWSAVRAGLKQLNDKPGVFFSNGLFDAALADTLHYTADAYVENGRRAGLSIRKALGYGGFDGRGPLVTGASRAGAVITLAVDLNGAASISGTSLTHYQVSADNFATLLTVSSAAVSGSNIVLTLSADPGAPVKVRSFYGMDWTTPVRAIGTYADGTTISVEPIYTAMVAA